MAHRRTPSAFSTHSTIWSESSYKDESRHSRTSTMTAVTPSILTSALRHSTSRERTQQHHVVFQTPEKPDPKSVNREEAEHAGASGSRTPSLRLLKSMPRDLVRLLPQGELQPYTAIGPYTQNASQLTTADALRILFSLGKILPPNVVGEILKCADCFHTITQTCSRRVAVDDDVLILSIPLTQGQCDRIVQMSLAIRGHDQGWLPTPEGSWPTNVSWTWYSMTGGDALDPSRRLATNKAGSGEPQRHAFEWDAASDEVRRIRQDGNVRVWAHARYFGWKNIVEDARITIRFLPLIMTSRRI